ncbi:hypothetical protein TYM08_P3466 [Marinicellulosiphila megalodicopiae]
MYVSINKNKKALPLYIKSMKGYENTLGDDHVITASVYNNLGELYRLIKQYDNAFPLIEKAINIRELEGGANPIDLAYSYNTMGVYYTDIKNYVKALDYLNKALNILNSTLGENHVNTKGAKTNIEFLYSLMNSESNNSIKKIKIGRNDSCHCGSGKKYKMCCV